MNPYDDPETLYDFLKNVKTVDEFFAKKEPAFDDAFMHETALAMLKDGSPEELVLSGLKATERQEYVEKFGERKKPN